MKVLLGITGGIAAYKDYTLIRLLVKAGHEVKTVITKSARQFVQPLVLETLSQNTCYTSLYGGGREIDHIALAKWADILVIAPATANIIAKISAGLADDLLSTTVLSFAKTICLFPAMNTTMYLNPAVQQNLEKMKERGILVFQPVCGDLACGDKGLGKLPDAQAIFDIITPFAQDKIKKIYQAITASPLKGKRVLLTAGASKAFIDPIRYISNSASSRNGVEIARALYLRGAEVYFIANRQVADDFPQIQVYATKVMLEDLSEGFLMSAKLYFADVDLYISTAALSDFANKPAAHKIKKDAAGVTLNLELGKDVFMELAARKKQQVMVGFALETEDLEKNALKKLADKSMDIIVANKAGVIGAQKTEGFIQDKNGTRELVEQSDKSVFAEQLVAFIEGYWQKFVGQQQK